MTPRKSFETWQTTVRGQSAPWSAADIRAASQLRVMLLEVVLRLTEEAGRERKRANEKQELLIAELNHRVRNILGLVRGLISQTSAGAISTEELVGKLDSRVQALARAHDQITRHHWAPAALETLIRTEAESYLLDKKARVETSGANVLLTAKAYASVALVIHEMMTNSAKYGALSSEGGKVRINWTLGDDQSLKIEWCEVGGPACSGPGTPRLRFNHHRARHPVRTLGPGRDVLSPGRRNRPVLAAGGTCRDRGRRRHAPRPQHQRSAAPRPSTHLDRVLIVEDNLMIAMDAEVIFEQIGSGETAVAPTAAAAMGMIERRDSPFTFALLDINLGNETSFEVARALKRDGVPFLFASGYGDSLTMPEDLEDIRILSKPYDKDMIRALFR